MTSYTATINATGIVQVTIINNTTPAVTSKKSFPATYTFTSGDSLTFIALVPTGSIFQSWTVSAVPYTTNPYTTAALTDNYEITGLATVVATSTYSSQTQVETWAQLSTSDLGTIGEDYEDSIAYYITVADRAIDSELEVPDGFFNAGGTEFTEVYDGAELGYSTSWFENPYAETNACPLLRLNYKPILSVDSVTVDGNTLTIDVDYLVDPLGIRFLKCFPRYSYGNITVVYTAGYTTTPSQISNVSAQLAAAIIQRVIASKGGTQGSSFTIGALSQSSSLSTPLAVGFAQSCFTADLKAELKRFRNIVPPRLA